MSFDRPSIWLSESPFVLFEQKLFARTQHCKCHPTVPEGMSEAFANHLEAFDVAVANFS